MTDGLNRLQKFVAVAAASLVLALMSSDAGSASRRICRQLEVDLASASDGGGSPVQVRKYDAAIVRQQEQLQVARKQARRQACGFSLFGRTISKCGSVNAQIDKMERNLDGLQRKREQLAGGGHGKSRAKILAALDANGCRGGETAERSGPGADRNKNLLDQIFGGGLRRRQPDEPNFDDSGFDRREPDAGGFDEDGLRVRRSLNPLDGTFSGEEGNAGLIVQTKDYSTVCVRTCDGYFFPMSSASSLGDFERDQKNCEAACPGSQVQIFYKAAGDESSDMVSSISGTPYGELPTAYLYKQSGAPRPESCGCNQPKSFKVIAGNPPQQSMSVLEPATEPAQATSEIETPPPAAAPAKPVFPSGDRKVRVVGPVFLPAPEAAIDLRAPARN